MSEPRLALPPGALERALRVRLARLDAEGFAARLHRRDVTLWGTDPAHQNVAANRLGWLDAPALMRPQTAALRSFATEVAGAGFTHAVLLGMGGSSLAPEVLRSACGIRPGALGLTVLDNTSPAAVDAVLRAHDPGRTLFVVSSKSGGTIEVNSFERCAREWSRAGRGDGGGAFVAITDPGTALERLARADGYRRVFLNPADIGGRYSALSLFGLAPGALIGADLDGLLDGALAELEACGPETTAERNPGLLLGAALGELALAGRDKLTLVLPAPLASLGGWIEQLLAESTGKDGKGIVPVEGETLAPPEAYGGDRAFVAVTVGEPPPELARALEALARAGHPVLRWSRPALEALGAEFVRWEIATAVAGAVLEVDPFDEPNVSEAKQATQALLEARGVHGTLPRLEPLASARGVEAAAPAAVSGRLRAQVGEPSDPAAWAAALPALVEPGDYFAILAYLHPTAARHQRLGELRHAVRAATRAATTLGYGPRFLHSTGQLHKGGPNRGVFLQLTAAEGDRPIPGERYGLLTLQQAQALGDYRVLERRGRRVLRLDLGSDVDGALDRLLAGFGAARRG